MKRLIFLIAMSSSLTFAMKNLELRQRVDDVSDQFRMAPQWVESAQIQKDLNRQLSDIAFNYDLERPQYNNDDAMSDVPSELRHSDQVQHGTRDHEQSYHPTPLGYQPSGRSSVPSPDVISGWLYKDDWIFPFVSAPDMSQDSDIAHYQTQLKRHDAASVAHAIESQQGNLQNLSFMDRYNRYKISRRLSFIARMVRQDQTMHYLLLIHKSANLEEACSGVEMLGGMLNARDSIIVDGQQVALNEQKVSNIMQMARRLVEQRADYQAEQQKHPASTMGGQLLDQGPSLSRIDVAFAKARKSSTSMSSSSKHEVTDTFTDVLTRKVNIHPSVDPQVKVALQELSETDPYFRQYLDVTIDKLKEMQEKGLLTPETTAFEHGIKHYIESMVPNNPLEHPQEFTINAIKYTALGAIHTWTGGVLIPLQTAAQIALKVNELQSVDTSKMTSKQYAEFISEELADISYQLVANKLVQKAKDTNIPQGFVRMTRDIFRGNDPQVALAGGGSVSAPKETTTAVLEHSGNKMRSGGASSQEVEWASNYPKHRPPKRVSWKEIMKTTKHGPAKYKPEINIRDLELHAWGHGQKVTIPGKNWKVLKYDKVIGANSGKETCYMRVECSANVIHGHPILEKDYLRYLK